MLSNIYSNSFSTTYKKGLIKNKNISIDSKSGFSGAGKILKKNLNIKIYIILHLLTALKMHRHIIEIDQEIIKHTKKNILYF